MGHLENVDVCPQIYNLGKIVTLETVDIWTPGAGSGRGVSQWRLWTYDPRCRVWEGCQPGYCGPVNQGAVWMWSHRRLWICEPRCSVRESSLSRGYMSDPRYRVWEGCHPGDYSCVTPGAGFVRGVTLETGRVTPGTWSGREITLVSVDM